MEKRNVKSMRKKLLSKTYLRDVSEYIIELSFTNEDYYLSKKKIIKTTPFVLSNGLKVIDNGYYILEILPKTENYAIKVYFDNNKNVIEYYIDITNGCGIDEISKIPYYDDLYLDITITDRKIEILDEDELENAYLNKLIDTSCSEIDKANLTTKNISIEHIIRKEHKNYSSRKLTFLELFSNQQNDDVLVTVSETSKYLNSKQTETKKTDVSINLINEKTKD